jgi:hypothetical protein
MVLELHCLGSSAMPLPSIESGKLEGVGVLDRQPTKGSTRSI